MPSTYCLATARMNGSSAGPALLRYHDGWDRCSPARRAAGGCGLARALLLIPVDARVPSIRHRLPVRRAMSEINPMVVDGNEAAASVAYRLSQVIAIYPITPASPNGRAL